MEKRWRVTDKGEREGRMGEAENNREAKKKRGVREIERAQHLWEKGIINCLPYK